MLKFISNLINLNVTLATKARSLIAYDEAMAFRRANEYKLALPLMIEASELGNQHATIEAATMLLRGQGTACDWKSAAEYLALAIERNVANVHFNLGMIFGIGGYGLKRDLAKAEYHLCQAQALDGDATAEQMLVMLRKKQGPFGGKETLRPQLPWK